MAINVRLDAEKMEKTCHTPMECMKHSDMLQTAMNISQILKLTKYTVIKSDSD